MTGRSRAAAAGLALAVSWLTVAPVRTGAPAPRVAAAALAWAPVVGALVGAAVGAVAAGLAVVGVPALVAGLLGVAAGALLTRGMHLDGLADTADGLGCYGPPERALMVMRDGGAGPFAVVTLVVAVGAQAGSLAALAAHPAAVVVAAALAGAVGRAGFAWCARRGVPAARPGGLGATVAGSQPWWTAVAWWVALAAVAAWAAASHRPGALAVGVLAVGVAALVTVALSAHTRRRFGGMTGDVLGAAAEIGTTAVLVVASTLS